MATIPPMEVRVFQIEPGMKFIPPGLTLREFAAVMYLHATVSRSNGTSAEGTAYHATKYADALIAALNQEATDAQ